MPVERLHVNVDRVDADPEPAADLLFGIAGQESVERLSHSGRQGGIGGRRRSAGRAAGGEEPTALAGRRRLRRFVILAKELRPDEPAQAGHGLSHAMDGGVWLRLESLKDP